MGRFGSLLMLFFIVGCNANYGDKVSYLEEVAQRGVEFHKIIEDTEGEEATEERCIEASRLLNRDQPSIETRQIEDREELKEDWENLIERVFVGACTSGKY